jgi:hypothetical protein
MTPPYDESMVKRIPPNVKGEKPVTERNET